MKVKYDKRVKVKRKAVCFYCDRPGHYKKDCFQYKAEIKNKVHKANATKEGIMDSSDIEGDNSDCDQICFKATGPPTGRDGWYMDSAATTHMTSNRHFFEKLNLDVKNKIFMANGSVMQAHGKGDGILKCTGLDGKIRSGAVKNVLFVPDLDGNLLSVRKLTQKGLTVNFEGELCYVLLHQKTIAVARVEKQSQLYRLKGDSNEIALVTSLAASKTCIHTWHSRMGHRGPQAIHQLVEKGLATGISIEKCSDENTCEVCLTGKMTRKPFPKKSEITTSRAFELVHSDICGPMNTTTPGGKRYFMTFIDDFTRFSMIYLLAHKSEAFSYFKKFKKLVKNKYEATLKILRTDGGGEYTSNEFEIYLSNKGIEHQVTTPYSPQQNSFAERKNRSLTEMAKCMLTEANIDNKFGVKPFIPPTIYRIGYRLEKLM